MLLRWVFVAGCHVLRFTQGTAGREGGSGEFLPPIFCPRRFNFNRPGLPSQVIQETTPGPPCRRVHQSASHRVALDVLHFLFLLGQTPDVEVVVPFLPEMIAIADELSRYGLLDGLDYARHWAFSSCATVVCGL